MCGFIKRSSSNSTPRSRTKLTGLMTSLPTSSTRSQWRTQKIAKGGPFSRRRKVDDLFFGKLPFVDLFFEYDNLTTFFFFFAHRSNATYHRLSVLSVSQILKGGGHLPVHLFSCLLQAVKNNIPSAKGGGHGPLAPPLGTPLLDLYS
jgi:hypothetical protein